MSLIGNVIQRLTHESAPEHTRKRTKRLRLKHGYGNTWDSAGNLFIPLVDPDNEARPIQLAISYDDLADLTRGQKLSGTSC